MIKLIIFDWDDVIIVGAKEGYFDCYEETFKKLRIKRNRAKEKRRILSRWGRSYRESLSQVFKESPELIEKACKIYEQNLFGNTYTKRLKLVKGVNDLLKNLSKKYTLAVVSGVHPKLLKERIIPKFKIPNVFSHIITFYDLDDPNKGKPHPYSIEEIMRRTGFNNNQTIFVGDTENDVLTAKNAKVTPVVVLTGHLNKNAAKKLGVKHIIPDVTRLEDIDILKD